MAVAHHRRRNGRGRRRCDLLGHVLVGIALAVAFAVRDAGILIDVLVLRCADRIILVHICANRAAVRHVRVHVGVDVLRGAGRDIGVQVRVIGRTCRTALVEIAVRVEVRRTRRTLIKVAIGVQIGAVNRAGRCAVNRLINGAGRNIGILVDVRCRAGGRILIDVGQRPRLDIIIRVNIRRCRCAGRCRDVVIVVRVGAGCSRCGCVDVVVGIRCRRCCGRVVDIVGGLGQHHARPAYSDKSKKPLIYHDQQPVADDLRFYEGGSASHQIDDQLIGISRPQTANGFPTESAGC